MITLSFVCIYDIFFYPCPCVMATIQLSAPMTVCTISLSIWFMVALLKHEMNENDIKRLILMIVWLGDSRKLMTCQYLIRFIKKANHINLRSFLAHAPWGELSYVDSEKCYGMKSICLHHDKCEFVYLSVS